MSTCIDTWSLGSGIAEWPSRRTFSQPLHVLRVVWIQHPWSIWAWLAKSTGAGQRSARIDDGDTRDRVAITGSLERNDITVSLSGRASRTSTPLLPRSTSKELRLAFPFASFFHRIFCPWPCVIFSLHSFNSSFVSSSSTPSKYQPAPSATVLSDAVVGHQEYNLNYNFLIRQIPDLTAAKRLPPPAFSSARLPLRVATQLSRTTAG